MLVRHFERIVVGTVRRLQRHSFNGANTLGRSVHRNGGHQRRAIPFLFNAPAVHVHHTG